MGSNLPLIKLPKLTLPKPYKRKPLNIRSLMKQKLFGMIKAGAFRPQGMVK